MVSSEVVVSSEELERRTIRKSQFVSCDQAFIDCRTPGSDKKQNYSMIGPGVTQNADQVVNLRERHGFQIGAAAMPHGITNNLHLHFTAEVFLCFRGEYLLRWGADGEEGQVVIKEGDIVSIPTWIFRGFTNIGPDDGWLFTALGMDDTGGIIWGPSVLATAAEHGLYLGADNELIDTAAGAELPDRDQLTVPLSADAIAGLPRFSVEQMERRRVSLDDVQWSSAALLDRALPGGGAELGLVIGFGMTEDRDQEPGIYNPHGHNIAWLRARPEHGVSAFRQQENQVLIVKDGTWEVTINRGPDAHTVRLGHQDMVSVPPGAYRSMRSVGPETGLLLAINSGDGRVRLDWDDEVVKAAADAGDALDHNGYLAPYALVPRRLGA